MSRCMSALIMSFKRFCGYRNVLLLPSYLTYASCITLWPFLDLKHSLFWVKCKKTQSYLWNYHLSSASRWRLIINNFHLHTAWVNCLTFPRDGTATVSLLKFTWFQSRGFQDLGLDFICLSAEQTRWHAAEFLCKGSSLVLKIVRLRHSTWSKWLYLPETRNISSFCFFFLVCVVVIAGFVVVWLVYYVFNYSFTNATMKRSCKGWRLYTRGTLW